MPSNYDEAKLILSRYDDVVQEMSDAEAVAKSYALGVAMQNAQVYALLAVADALSNAKPSE